MNGKILFFIAVFLSISKLYSQVIPYGIEFQVNTSQHRSKKFPSIAKFKNGGFVVCWQSLGQDGSHNGIIGQLFDSKRNKHGNEFQVNSYTKNEQTNPVVTDLKDDGFVVCWQSLEQDRSGYGVYAQLFNINGTKKHTEFQVTTYENKSQKFPVVTTLRNGNIVVCWENWSLENSSCEILGQIFDENCDKKHAGFNVNSYSGDPQFSPTIATLNDSGFVVCWQSCWGDDCSRFGIFGQLFDVNGGKKSAEFRVNTYKHGMQESPRITTLSNGDFIVCWESWGQDGSGVGIFGQLFDTCGIKKGTEFQVNTYVENNQNHLALAALHNGGFIVCWQSSGQDGSTYGIFGQLFNGAGNKTRQEFQVNTYAERNQTNPAIATLAEPIIFICWENQGRLGPGAGILGKFLPQPNSIQLQPFSLIFPKNDASLNNIMPTVSWQSPRALFAFYPWEFSFDLYIDTDYNFSNPQVIKDIIDTTFTLDGLSAGQTYFWKVLAKNIAGDSLWSTQQNWGFFIEHGASVEEISDVILPSNFSLQQNYPNPFNSQTEIKYASPVGKVSYHVVLKIYDMLGRVVKVLVDKDQSAGAFSVNWDRTDLSGNRVVSGVYFYSLEVREFKMTKKMLVLE